MAIQLDKLDNDGINKLKHLLWLQGVSDFILIYESSFGNTKRMLVCCRKEWEGEVKNNLDLIKNKLKDKLDKKRFTHKPKSKVNVSKKT